MGKVVVRSAFSKVVRNKNGTQSTFRKLTVNGKTKWQKSGGPSTKQARAKPTKF